MKSFLLDQLLFILSESINLKLLVLEVKVCLTKQIYISDFSQPHAVKFSKVKLSITLKLMFAIQLFLYGKQAYFWLQVFLTWLDYSKSFQRNKLINFALFYFLGTSMDCTTHHKLVKMPVIVNRCVWTPWNLSSTRRYSFFCTSNIVSVFIWYTNISGENASLKRTYGNQSVDACKISLPREEQTHSSHKQCGSRSPSSALFSHQPTYNTGDWSSSLLRFDQFRNYR